MDNSLGKVRCGKFSRGTVHPKLDGYMNINVCTVDKNWGQKLSPMKLGPFYIVEDLNPNFPDGLCPGFTLTDNGRQTILCNTLEGYWQYSKVYSVDVDGTTIKPSFLERRSKGVTNTGKPKRRVFPAKSGITTICAYHDSKFHTYQESRLYYCHYYSELVVQQEKYRELKRLMISGQNILVIDVDGPSFDSHLVELTPEFFKCEYADTTHPFGHGMVLSSMLLGMEPWK